jgi:hypothetical protein
MLHTFRRRRLGSALARCTGRRSSDGGFVPDKASRKTPQSGAGGTLGFGNGLYDGL